VFAGLVAYLSGLINFGIFPSVSARFFIALCGLPERFHVGGLPLATFPVLMILLIGVSLFFTFIGGQIAVMVTDFLQGAFVNITFIVLILFLLMTFKWEQVSTALLAAPRQESLVNPFHLGQESNFNVWYYMIGVVIMFYGAMAWQGTQGYNCAARNAHEAKMAGILGGWRFRVLMLIVVVLPVCVRTVLYHPDFAAQAASVNGRLAAIPSESLQNQMRTPLAMAAIFPAGLLGLACAAALAANIGTHGAYLHSWGAILVQDVILPFRRKPFTPAQHLRLLKLSISAVAVFILLFSLLFRHTQYIAMFCALTASVFVGGAGSVIIGGLYWKRGTTAGAWAAMLTGTGLSLAGMVIKQIDPAFLHSLQPHPAWGGIASLALYLQTSFTGQEMTFWAIVLAVAAYVGVSLLGPRTLFNMDRLLHRGPYAIPGETVDAGDAPKRWWERLGFTREFTGTDRIVTYVTLGWPLVWTVIFVVGTVYNLLADVPDQSWLKYWHGWTWFILACAVLVTIWFTIGGFRDLRDLYRLLRLRRDNPTDDGRVESPL
jgi:SSS family solute:Na+ symporter